MYGIQYEADYAEQQGRWRTFFRLILAIPWYILGSVYVIGASIVALIAWFALLFTGRYPEGLYNFNAGVLRFVGRANAFAYLQTQEYPPFGLEEASGYPVRVKVDPPLESYNRWKVAFRLIVGIPVLVMGYIFSTLIQWVALIAWLHIVFTTRTSGGTHNALSYANAYFVRATGYFLLLTETLPPISDQAPAEALAAPKPKALAKPKAKASAAAKPKPRATAKAKAKAKPKAKPKPKPRKKS
jgi:hypothetical protein